LTRHPQYNRKEHHVTLLEATKVAGGASGKAGGCLASWATPSCLAGLSFQLHAELAAEHDGPKNWGYRRAHCWECETSNETSSDNAPAIASNEIGLDCTSAPEWVFPGRLRSCVECGNTQNTGQVHPYLFTTFLADQAKSSGVEIILGSATAINYSENGTAVRSVSFKKKDSGVAVELDADHVVLAAGPWTPDLLPAAPIGGSRSHSIVLSVPTKNMSPNILFFNNPNPNSWFPKLEVYPRPDDTTYVCGPTDHRVPLPSSTDLVEVDSESCQLIRRAAESLSSQLVRRDVLIEQACYRPVVKVSGRDRSTGPLFGKTGVTGLILAAGHDQWGIQNSLATGKVISELIFDGESVSADISTLDPSKVLV
jgi:glycine/D-amino acid oxidase-like deaminating enzyme